MLFERKTMDSYSLLVFIILLNFVASRKLPGSEQDGIKIDLGKWKNLK